MRKKQKAQSPLSGYAQHVIIPRAREIDRKCCGPRSSPKDRGQTMATAVSGDNKRAASARSRVVPNSAASRDIRRYRILLLANHLLFSFEPIEGW